LSERRGGQARGVGAWGRHRAAIAHGCLLLCLVLLALPIVLVQWLPIFDYPNHLARAHVIDRLAGSAVFAAHMHTTNFLIPNVLADLLVLALIPFGGVLMAGKALLVATFALTLTGVHAVNRVLTGQFSPWPLLAAALLYNEGFFWGFLNYNLGLGLLLWGVMVWLVLQGRTAGERMVVGACFALLIFLAHLVAFGLYAVAVAVIELRRPNSARLAQAAAQFVPPLVIFLTLSPAGDLQLVALFDFSITGKVMPFARILSSGNPILDFATLAALGGVVATGLLGGLARCQGTLLLLAATFLVLVATMPFSMLGSYFLDSRIIFAFALMFAASLTPRGRISSAGIAVIVLVIVGGRSLGLMADWREQEAEYAALVAALDRVPPGSVVVTTVQYPFELGDWVMTRRVKPSHEHSTLYATIRNDVLVPNIFARQGQNPLVFDSPLEDLDRLARNPVGRISHSGDARWLIGEVMPLANHRATIAPPIPAVYVVGYGVPCAWWPADMPIRAEQCTPAFSLIEILGDVGEPVP
jgi:hypothetical protein